MLKHKIGDEVTIKSDLKVDEYYGVDMVVSKMIEYFGNKAKITRLLKDKYELDIDDGEWCWTDEMFEDN